MPFDHQGLGAMDEDRRNPFRRPDWNRSRGRARVHAVGFVLDEVGHTTARSTEPIDDASLTHTTDVTDDDSNAPLRIIFLSRISPMKNVHYALDVLSKVRLPISFHIHGPVEDEAYWRQCEAHIAQSPGHIDITYRGSVMFDQVAETMPNHDPFFFSPHEERTMAITIIS
jgi:glycosyltransferase involved in cell wall biosynthesis